MGLYSGPKNDPVEVRRAELEKAYQSYEKAMAATMKKIK